MKKIIVISMGLETNRLICKQLDELVGNLYVVIGYCICNDISINPSESYIVFTSLDVKELFISKYKLDCEYIVARRVINYSKLSELISLPSGSEVLLVNNSKQSCYEVIEQFEKISIDHIKFFPYYPGIDDYKRLKLAVTPGESHAAPSCVTEIIDIGIRQMDITTIIEMLIKFNILLDESSKFISFQFVRDMVELSKKYKEMANQYLKMKNMFEVIVDNTSEGIIYLDALGSISIVNEVFISMFETSKERILNREMEEVLPELKCLTIDKSDSLFKIKGKSLSANKAPIKSGNNITGYIITIRDVTEIQKLEYEIRRKMQEKEYVAKYSFDDILTRSALVKKNISIAKKLAVSNSAILIQGESGTGKELFAQAIHNASERRNRQFVPINFAALSSSLLESEIFGYEEGSFTGAKKGGKFGFFEEAHGGTIFLDEIGDTPLEFQTTLLRVLQEKQVRRVGGSKLIPIDVKVIAATNKDLKLMVENGKFRKDLFYRLNILPLYINPLRERKEDIKVLLDSFLKKHSKTETLTITEFFSKEVIECLNSYDWPGNVRELSNIVEYLVNIKNNNILIEIGDLPEYMICNRNKKLDKVYNFLYNDEIIWLLSKIGENVNIGRRKLNNISKSEELGFTEAKIKKLMKVMADEELIDINIGVKGTTITQKGKNLLKNIKINR